MPEAGAASAAEHEMIDERAVDRFGRTSKPARGAAVALARGRVPARVVMREHESRAAVKRRILDNRAERKIGPALVPGMASEVNAIGLIVEMGDPEALATGTEIFDAAGKEGARRGKAVELQRNFGTLISHHSGVPEHLGSNDRNRVGSGEEYIRNGYGRTCRTNLYGKKCIDIVTLFRYMPGTVRKTVRAGLLRGRRGPICMERVRG